MYSIGIHCVEKIEIVDGTQSSDYDPKGFIHVKHLKIHTDNGVVDLTLFSDDLARVSYSDEREHSVLDGVHAAVAVGGEA